jgi:hypothetical protein
MKAPLWIVPALVIAAAASGVGGARLFAAPSFVRVYDHAAATPDATKRSALFVVEGVRCVDTAERAAKQLEGESGVIRFTSWASRAKVEIVFDPAITDVTALREAIEGPVYDDASGEFLFGLYVVREVDGAKVEG